MQTLLVKHNPACLRIIVHKDTCEIYMQMRTDACRCPGKRGSSSLLALWFEWSKSSLCSGGRLMASLNSMATHSIQSGRSVGQLRVRLLLWPSDISIYHHPVCILLLLLLSEGTRSSVWRFICSNGEKRGYVAYIHSVYEDMQYSKSIGKSVSRNVF